MKRIYKRTFYLLVSLGLVIGFACILLAFFFPLTGESLSLHLLFGAGVYTTIFFVYNVKFSRAVGRQTAVVPEKIGGWELDIIVFVDQLRPLSRWAFSLSILVQILYLFPFLFFFGYLNNFVLGLSSLWFYSALFLALHTARNSRRLYFSWANVALFYILRNYSKLTDFSHRKAVVQHTVHAIINQVKRGLPWVDEIQVERQVAILGLALATGTDEEQAFAKKLCQELTRGFGSHPVFSRAILEILTETEGPRLERYREMADRFRIRVGIQRTRDVVKVILAYLVPFLSMLFSAWRILFPPLLVP